MMERVPELSVVVAAQDAGPLLHSCLAALKSQFAATPLEVIVAQGSGRSGVAADLGRFGFARVLDCPAGSSVPDLWTQGIRAARGRLVAITYENCCPAQDWAAQLVAAHQVSAAGVGGAIEPGALSKLVDWAVYFCRYSNSMLPIEKRAIDDLAGDNCCYIRDALTAVDSLMSDGFWETFIHRNMRSRNQTLLAVPGPVVVYQGGLEGWRFFRRRFIHARYFAARLSRGMSVTERVARAFVFPAVPFLLFRRIGGRVWRNGRFRRRFVLATPLVFAFLTAWACGEAAGYAFGFRGTPHGGAA